MSGLLVTVQYCVASQVGNTGAMLASGLSGVLECSEYCQILVHVNVDGANDVTPRSANFCTVLYCQLSNLI